jgi:hypothetical protein
MLDLVQNLCTADFRIRLVRPRATHIAHLPVVRVRCYGAMAINHKYMRLFPGIQCNFRKYRKVTQRQPSYQSGKACLLTSDKRGTGD